MIDSTIVRLLLKDNFKESFDILEKTGGSLYLNNTINKWLLSIFIQGISEMYSNFIWDLFLLEGNFVIFKAIYAIFVILQKYINKHKSFEDLNVAFNEIPLQFNNRGRLAYYLIGKQFNFSMDAIKKYRKCLASQIINEIMGLGSFNNYEDDDDEDEKDNNNIKKEKKIVCDLDWPQCVNDKKNLEKENDFVVLKELEKPNVIDDYIDYYKQYKNGIKNIGYNNKKKSLFNNDIKNQKIKHLKEEKFKDLLIERKKHFCGSNIMSIRSSLCEKEKNNNIKKDNLGNKKVKQLINKFNERKNSDERDRRIDRIVTHVSIGNRSKIAFKKETIEKEVLFDDDN